MQVSLHEMHVWLNEVFAIDLSIKNLFYMKYILIILTIMLMGHSVSAQQTNREKLKTYMSQFFIERADHYIDRDSVMRYSGNVNLTILGNAARCDTAIVIFRGNGISEGNKTANIEMLHATLKGNIRIQGMDNMVIYADSLYIDLNKR